MDVTLYDWAEQAAQALELPSDARWVAERDTVIWVLDLARDIARGAARPAAPVGAFLAGVAIGLAGAQDRELLGQTLTLLGGPMSTAVDVEP